VLKTCVYRLLLPPSCAQRKKSCTISMSSLPMRLVVYCAVQRTGKKNKHWVFFHCNVHRREWESSRSFEWVTNAHLTSCLATLLVEFFLSLCKIVALVWEAYATTRELQSLLNAKLARGEFAEDFVTLRQCFDFTRHLV
jgi:hypothetical protein